MSLFSGRTPNRY